MPKKSLDSEARYEYAGLDRLLHERARLSLLTSLAAHPYGLVFNELKRLCRLTDGNLSRHLALLQSAGLVDIRKDFHRQRPRTSCRITAAGRARFAAYLAELERVVRDSAAAVHAERASVRRPLPTTP
ncbi:MAG TPA: transcriptional regulator [Terriglobales bacterium]|nr:transcriptional regulator [Terriglobales bacterium]